MSYSKDLKSAKSKDKERIRDKERLRDKERPTHIAHQQIAKERTITASNKKFKKEHD